MVVALFQVLKECKQSLFNTVSEQHSFALTLTIQNISLNVNGWYYKNTKINTVSLCIKQKFLGDHVSMIQTFKINTVNAILNMRLIW